MLNYYKFYEVEKLIVQGKLDEACNALTELQKCYASLNDETAKLRNQVHYLEELLYISRNLIFDGDAYWLISEGQKQGPFCPKCYHENGSLIRLNVQGLNTFEILSAKERWACVHCGTTITPETETTNTQTNQWPTASTEWRSLFSLGVHSTKCSQHWLRTPGRLPKSFPCSLIPIFSEHHI